MNKRLEQLKGELEKGRQRLEALERERQNVRDMLLRISGAIQVLEELQAEDLLENKPSGELQSAA
jgi:predicted nuclease with TOPRIM domain